VKEPMVSPSQTNAQNILIDRNSFYIKCRTAGKTRIVAFSQGKLDMQ